jgi:hypothetical protein
VNPTSEGPFTEKPLPESRLAARAVALYEEIPLAERKELLDMLGLLDDDGQLIELPVLMVTSPRPLAESNEVKLVNREVPWDRSTVPPGLRDLPPPALESKSRQRAKVQRSDCGDKRGTLTGRRRHQANGTPVCKECAEAYATWQREWKAKGGSGTEPCGDKRGTVDGVARHKQWRSKMCPDCAKVAQEANRLRRAEKRKEPITLPGRPETCGSMAGRANHLRRGEKLCRACKDVQNAYQRARRLQRLAEQQEGVA